MAETKDKKNVSLLLLAQELIYRLDEKWVKLRDQILDGRIDPLEGAKLFRCCVEATVRVMEDESGIIEAAPPRASGIPVIDLGEDTEEELAGPETPPTSLARIGLAAVRRPSRPPPPKNGKPHDPVEDWRETMESFYERYGFAVNVPRPAVSAEELEKWRADGWEIFYRPAEREASYEKLLCAFGHEGHATLKTEERLFFSWEPADVGYWFLAEAVETIPRSGKAFVDYTRETPVGQSLLCLEEYVVLWHAMKDLLGVILDHDHSTLLRTRYKTEVLHARSRIDRTVIEFFVRGWPGKISSKAIGTRFSRVIQSAI
jgi:hypothetical protein